LQPSYLKLLQFVAKSEVSSTIAELLKYWH